MQIDMIELKRDKLRMVRCLQISKLGKNLKDISHFGTFSGNRFYKYNMYGSGVNFQFIVYSMQRK